MKKIEEVDNYLNAFEGEASAMLRQLREEVHKSAPDAEESIGYGMPAYKYYGILLYFAAYKKHIGFYPGSSVLKAFTDELSEYKKAKGSIQFPLGKPLPLDLISAMVKFKVIENREKRKTDIKK